MHSFLALFLLIQKFSLSSDVPAVAFVGYVPPELAASSLTFSALPSSRASLTTSVISAAVISTQSPGYRVCTPCTVRSSQVSENRESSGANASDTWISRRRSCVRGASTPCRVRSALRSFSTNCWQWKQTVSAGHRSLASRISTAFQSLSALARYCRTAPTVSSGIQDLPGFLREVHDGVDHGPCPSVLLGGLDDDIKRRRNVDQQTPNGAVAL